ncbi:hypothetical protein HanIR_Chr15g0778061 [Helianthus annuus]|nr:hypothetical protein HanIR_Chr15g0778061 [Helianthus annuus]
MCLLALCHRFSIVDPQLSGSPRPWVELVSSPFRFALRTLNLIVSIVSLLLYHISGFD